MFKLLKKHHPKLGGLEILKFVGPGFLVTAGFIDPGNWAANVAAGSLFGYKLLWMVTLATFMLIVLQHNAAHLGIVTGLCISEAATKHYRRPVSVALLATAVAASVSTALAEILGAAIGLRMLVGLPLNVGAVFTTILVAAMLFTHSYRKLERWIIGFVSLVGISFLYEMSLSGVDWHQAASGWIVPDIPHGALPIVISVLGAVVMPHNLFLHSEIIQSRQWNLEGGGVIRKHLKYEFLDTFAAMWLGWGINSAMIVVAAAVFFAHGTEVTDLSQAEEILRPLLGNSAAVVFAFALICAGVASSVTAAMAGGSIFAGIFEEPFNVDDLHSRIGIGLTLVGAMVIIFLIGDPFRGLIWSQIMLSIQLPITIFTLIFLTSSKRVMGDHANSWTMKILGSCIAIFVTVLDVTLIVQMM